MSTSRRHLISTMLAAPLAGVAQTFSNPGATVGFKADNGPVRTECGVGALMPWADALWAVTYNSHMKGRLRLGLFRIDEKLNSSAFRA